MRSPEKATEAPSDAGVDRGRLWKALLFGAVGATAATTFAVTQLRQTVTWFSNQNLWLVSILLLTFSHRLGCDDLAQSLILLQQLSRSPLYASWRSAISGFCPKSFREEAWKKSSRRMQEEYEEEMERVERIRRMQSVFNRERNKYKRSYESWKDSGPGAYQQFPRDDWYWKTDTTYKHQRNNSGAVQRESGLHALSHHYSILGLDRFRTKPYTEEEIKTAFREKAKEYHPDQNQNNKEVAEEKFKEVLTSYEAIKLDRKNK